ncbi:hypothetical protein Hanom_Chr14g01249021 [Helianthus anomalus]
MATISPFHLYSPLPVTVSSESQPSHGVFRHEHHLCFRTSTFRHKTLRIHSRRTTRK